MKTGVWGTANDPHLTIIDAPQRALVHDLGRVIDDPDTLRRVVLTIAGHLYVTASEKLLSPSWQRYSLTLQHVAEHLPTSRPQADSGTSQDATE